jgi:hypothetical protein
LVFSVGCPANGFQVRIQFGAEHFDVCLQGGSLLRCEQLPAERAPEPVLDFEQRTPGDSDKAAVLVMALPAAPFRDIRSDTVGGLDQLLPDGVAWQDVPFEDDLPNGIR